MSAPPDTRFGLEPETGPAFYRPGQDCFVPTGLGASPWAPDAQLGVCLAGLAAHVLGDTPSLQPMLTTRLTIDILGAVPMRPLVAATRVLREGRRMQIVEAELRIGETAWVRATALRVRLDHSPALPAPPSRDFPPAARPERFGDWVETIRVDGDLRVPGPGALWVRMLSPLIEGLALRPLEAVAMASDFGTATAPLVPIERWTFANVDVSIHLSREPAGGWMLLDATSENAGNGIGVTHARLGDRTGMVGMAHQTAFLAPRPA